MALSSIESCIIQRASIQRYLNPIARVTCTASCKVRGKLVTSITAMCSAMFALNVKIGCRPPQT